MKTHTTMGADMLLELGRHHVGNALMEYAYQIARWHHERWDGKGYPDGLKGDEIPDVYKRQGELKQGDFDALVADELDVEPEQILSRDLFLVNRQDARIWGWADEFISTPKLDDLACAYTSLQAFLGAENARDVSVFCCFDNEEVGSETKQGAMSTFLADALRRINGSLGFDDESYHRALAASMLVSCDNAHAVHPNHAEKDVYKRQLSALTGQSSAAHSS